MQRERTPAVRTKTNHTATQKKIFASNRLFIQGMLRETDLEYNTRILEAGCDYAFIKMKSLYPIMKESELINHMNDIIFQKSYWNFWVNVFYGFEQDFCNMMIYDESIDYEWFKIQLDLELKYLFGTRLLDCNFWNYIERMNYE